MVPPVGLEPTILGLRGRSFNQLSYRGILYIVPPVGLEPTPLGLKGHSSNQLSYEGMHLNQFVILF